MIKIFTIILVLFVFGCASTQNRDSVPENYKVIDLNRSFNTWIQSDLYEDKTKNDDILVFAKHVYIDSIKYNKTKHKSEKVKIERKIADYFLVINNDLGNGFSFLNNEVKNIRLLSSGKEKISSVEFITETKLFNTVKNKKSEIYNLINKGFYSAPDCGLIKSYISTELNLSFYAIDKVSCGQLNIEVNLKSYRKAFIERREMFSLFTSNLFGFIEK